MSIQLARFIEGKAPVKIYKPNLTDLKKRE